MYELLFRSRWYALIWALFMAAGAIVFTTTGAGAWLTGTQPEAHASREAHDAQFHAWSEEDKRRAADESGFDPSSPERVRDGVPPEADDAAHRTAPFAADGSDEDAGDEADAP